MRFLRGRLGRAAATVSQPAGLVAIMIAHKALSSSFTFSLNAVFGVDNRVDSFFIAQIIPFMAGAVVATSITSVLVTMWGEMTGSDYTGYTVMAALSSVAAAALLATYPVEALRVARLSHAPAALTLDLLVAMSPALPLTVVSGCLTASYYAEGRMWVPGSSNLLPYVGGLVGVWWATEGGFHRIAHGLVAGSAAQAALLAWGASARWRRAWPPRWPRTSLLPRLAAVAAHTSAGTAQLAIDRAAAQDGEPGMVSCVALAGNLTTIPFQLIATPFAQSLLVRSAMEQRSGEAKPAEAITTVRTAVWLVAALSAAFGLLSTYLVMPFTRGSALAPVAAQLVTWYAPLAVANSLREVACAPLLARSATWSAALIGLAAVAGSAGLKAIDAGPAVPFRIPVTTYLAALPAALFAVWAMAAPVRGGGRATVISTAVVLVLAPLSADSTGSAILFMMAGIAAPFLAVEALRRWGPALSRP